MGGKGSGRISRPSALKLIEGRSPGRDSGGRIVAQTPKFVREAPDPPAWLDGAARDEWDRVVAELEPLDLLKSTDAQALACYCQAVADHAAAVAIVAAEGRVITNPKTGHQHPHPAVADARASRAQILQFAREFGFSPAAEQRLASLPTDSSDDSNPFAG
ncbi:phage terminase small subunit P27 family [Mycobacterium riyadhense]|uniref:Terminase n=1 Tax=Mycobacterium riyadhense TaxID=486698 RepID=A0A1X2DGP1_9MYCO|nr:phage terminase small subunit P27 family [Mycobacterium riyadhense]MCV7146339.1 phage terminase small subunit P27 family [Mycobacterium riyadhense]ORW87200.1 terminase [Mycobacterium riyadhense]VTO94722.1 Phage terminase, small subunit [Mycobacterium riyadhense]